MKCIDRVKIFHSSNDSEEIENEINKWLSKQEDIEIVLIRSTQSQRLNYNYYVIIHYKQKNHADKNICRL
jgi:hypothetical protein